MTLHTTFDVASLIGGIGIAFLYKKTFFRNIPNPVPSALRTNYLFAVLLGLVFGAYLFGTMNAVFSYSDHAGFLLGKSVVGGIIGGVVGAEIFKWRKGIRGSTGIFFVPALALGIGIGRIGCFLTGLSDFTFGMPTDFFLGVDFGDGVKRHPVQLYESFSMFLFLGVFTFCMWRKNSFWIRNAFYIFVFFYAVQRFFWEFLKPYATIFLNLNIFHCVTILLALYALYMTAINEKRYLEITRNM